METKRGAGAGAGAGAGSGSGSSGVGSKNAGPAQKQQQQQTPAHLNQLCDAHASLTELARARRFRATFDDLQAFVKASETEEAKLRINQKAIVRYELAAGLPSSDIVAKTYYELGGWLTLADQHGAFLAGKQQCRQIHADPVRTALRFYLEFDLELGSNCLSACGPTASTTHPWLVAVHHGVVERHKLTQRDPFRPPDGAYSSPAAKSVMTRYYFWHEHQADTRRSFSKSDIDAMVEQTKLRAQYNMLVTGTDRFVVFMTRPAAKATDGNIFAYRVILADKTIATQLLESASKLRAELLCWKWPPLLPASLDKSDEQKSLSNMAKSIRGFAPPGVASTFSVDDIIQCLTDETSGMEALIKVAVDSVAAAAAAAASAAASARQKRQQQQQQTKWAGASGAAGAAGATGAAVAADVSAAFRTSGAATSLPPPTSSRQDQDEDDGGEIMEEDS